MRTPSNPAEIRRRNFVRFKVERPAKDDDRCQCCDRVLTGTVVLLELDQRDGTYHQDGVPERWSQGWFPFGKLCAKRKIKNRNAKILDRAWEIAQRSKAHRMP